MIRSFRRKVVAKKDAVKVRARAIADAIQFATGPSRLFRYKNTNKQKSGIHMAIDNILWSAKRGRVNDAYFLLGLDSVSAPTLLTLSSRYDEHKLRKVIDRQIDKRDAHTQAALLRDKALFGLVAKALGHATPENIAILKPDCVTLLSPRRDIDYDSFAKNGNFDGFCKPVRGALGVNCFPLEVQNGILKMERRGISSDQLKAKICSQRLFQSRIVQHPDIGKLYSGAINSLRIITASIKGHIFPFEAALRIGALGSVVDNWSAGGLLVSIDINTGYLKGRGLFKPAHILGEGREVAVTHHPDTGIELNGFPIPFFKESLELACQFHSDLDLLTTIAWDVALTPGGPVVIEGNTHWDARAHMALDCSFQGRYCQVLRSA